MSAIRLSDEELDALIDVVETAPFEAVFGVDIEKMLAVAGEK